MEIEEVSVKISGRKDINKIYKENGRKALESFVTDCPEW